MEGGFWQQFNFIKVNQLKSILIAERFVESAAALTNGLEAEGD